MANVSWYGGASVRGQTWPINDLNMTVQPFIIGDLKDTPSGFGSPLERYFLGSSGKVPLMGLTIHNLLSLTVRVTALKEQIHRPPPTHTQTHPRTQIESCFLMCNMKHGQLFLTRVVEI